MCTGAVETSRGHQTPWATWCRLLGTEGKSSGRRAGTCSWLLNHFSSFCLRPHSTEVVLTTVRWGAVGTCGVCIRKTILKPNGKYLFLIEIGKVSQEECVCMLCMCVCVCTHIVCFYRYVCANGRQKLTSGVFLCCFLLVLSLSLNAISLNWEGHWAPWVCLISMPIVKITDVYGHPHLFMWVLGTQTRVLWPFTHWATSSAWSNVNGSWVLIAMHPFKQICQKYYLRPRWST